MMKQMIAKLFKPIKPAEYVMMAVFIIINMLYCSLMYIIALFIMFNAEEWSTVFFKSNTMQNILTFSFKRLDALILTILAGLLVQKWRTWKISLLIQLLLYTVVVCLVHGRFMSICECILTSIIVILYQIPGVTVGLSIRYLLHKIKARKQPVQAE